MAKRAKYVAKRAMPREDQGKGRQDSEGRQPNKGLQIALLVIASVLLILGLLAAWQLFGSNLLAEKRSDELVKKFQSDCTNSGVVAILEMPTITDRKIPVLEGTGRNQLNRGVGWYQQTAKPGSQGNTALVGYRITDGQPFHDLLKLSRGDKVTLTTCEATHRYEIVVEPKNLTVNAKDEWVLDAVPGNPSQLPSAPMLTLITNQDLLPTADRAVGFAKYIGTE